MTRETDMPAGGAPSAKEPALPVGEAMAPRPPIGVPLAILAVLTTLVLAFDLDNRVARHYYAGQGVWRLDSNWLVQLLYNYGTWPAIIAVAACALKFAIGSIKRRTMAAKHLGVYAALVLILGPGLVVNAVFKDHFGRPRPRNVIEFGGAEKFVEVFHPRLGMEGASFPSGHASMGFLWFAFAVYYRARDRRLALWFTALALTHGAAMGYGRIAQGAHWFSDVVWSAGFVYLVSWMIYNWMNFGPHKPA